MKRIFVILLALGLLSAACPARAEDKRAELAKIRAYIKALDKNILQAREARKINKLAELKHYKRQALERAKKLKAGMGWTKDEDKEQEDEDKAKVKAKVRWPNHTKVQRPGPGWEAGFGYRGGAFVVGAGYAFPFNSIGMTANAGYGFGNRFSLLTAGVGAAVPVGMNHAGLELSLVNYSAALSGVPGVGSVNQGLAFGLGVFAGTEVNAVRVRLGYNTVMGLTAGAAYRFY
jgi:hypothetical protein